MALDVFFTKKQSEVLGRFEKDTFLIRYFENLGFDYSEQESFRISKEDAEVLLSRCKRILKDNTLADELLPSDEQAYDESYFSGVSKVKDYVKNKLLPCFDTLEEGEEIHLEIL